MRILISIKSILREFYLPAAGRIAHDVLTGIGLAVLAVSLWRARTGIAGSASAPAASSSSAA